MVYFGDFLQPLIQRGRLVKNKPSLARSRRFQQTFGSQSSSALPFCRVALNQSPISSNYTTIRKSSSFNNALSSVTTKFYERINGSLPGFKVLPRFTRSNPLIKNPTLSFHNAGRSNPYSGMARFLPNKFSKTHSGLVSSWSAPNPLFRPNSPLGKRFLAAMIVRSYADANFKLVSALSKLFKALLISPFGLFAKLGAQSARFLSSLMAAGVAALSYIEYKLQQVYNTGSLTEKYNKFSDYMAGLRDEWSSFSLFKKKEKSSNSSGKSGNSDKGSENENPKHGNNSNNNSPLNTIPLAATIINQTDFDEYGEAEQGMKSEKNTDNSNHSSLQDTLHRDDNILMKLTKKLLEIQSTLRILNKNGPDSQSSMSMQLPMIVVIGSQSSGKSSVLEAIVGQQFLPKGTNMVTRRPIELTLVYEPSAEIPYGEFPTLGLNRIKNFKEIQKTLVDLNQSVPESECVSEDPIELKIYSKSIPDLRLVDLPGYIQVTNRNQPAALKQKISNLCSKYLVEPNIILAVSAADVDLANSEALLAARLNDPLGLRTIGVITKVDMVSPREAVRTLSQNDYPLHLGYVGVISKPITVKQIAGAKTKPPQAMTESDYYRNNIEFRKSHVEVGVGVLRRKLVRILENSMSQSLSGLVDAVQADLAETKYEIKVQYNDERITAESYLADTFDGLKQKVKLFKQEFGKQQVRDHIQSYLEGRVVKICEELYWNDQRINHPSDFDTETEQNGWLKSYFSGLYEVLALASSAASSVLIELKHASSGSMELPQTMKSSKYTSKRRKGESGSHSSNNTRDSYQNTMLMKQQLEFEKNEHEIYLDRKLTQATSLLVKSGIGRNTTKLVVDLIMYNIHELVDSSSFYYHPEARNDLIQMSSEVLRSKYVSTIDQVENTIKPLKYEIEPEIFEWQMARVSSLRMLDDEIEKCKSDLKDAKASVPRKQLIESMKIISKAVEKGISPDKVISEVMKTIELRPVSPASQKPDLPKRDLSRLSEYNANTKSEQLKQDQTINLDEEREQNEQLEQPSLSQTAETAPSFTPSAVAAIDAGTIVNMHALMAAQRIISLQNTYQTLRFRKQVISSSKCSDPENKKICAETFLVMLSSKLAYSAVLFINYELLQNFFFEVPRNIDAKMYSMYRNRTDKASRKFADQNPKVRSHLALLERRDVLEEVMTKLNDIIREQNLANSYAERWEFS